MKDLRLRHYYGAGMILYTKDGNNCSILLEKRSDDHTWAIPGGAVEEWEKYIEAAKRETLEETGIKIDSAWPVMNYHLPYFSYYVFASELSHKTVPRKNWESDAIEWFSLENLPEGMNWMTKIEIKDFIRKEKKHVERRTEEDDNQAFRRSWSNNAQGSSEGKIHLCSRIRRESLHH